MSDLTPKNPIILGSDGKPIRKGALDEYDPGMVLPQVLTFSSLLRGSSQTYYRERFDEAMRHSRENAIAMRLDEHLQACLRERIRGTTNLSWHIEPDNAKDKWQKNCAEGVERIIRGTHRFRRLKKQSMQALWYGRYGTQMQWVWKQMDLPNPKTGESEPANALTIRRHFPVNGDKIDYTWDHTPTVRLHSGEASKYPKDDTVIDNLGYSLVLGPKYRHRFLIHSWEPDDGDFYDAESASAIHGVGIRSWLYWSWWTKNEYMSAVADALERYGLGFIVIYYDPANPQAKTAAENIGKTYSHRSILTIPRSEVGRHSGGIEVVQTPTAGMEVLLTLQRACEEREERFIIAQTMSSSGKGSAALGGSGAAEFQGETKWDVIAEDANELAETLTGSDDEPGIVSTIQKWTYPFADFPLRMVFDTEPRDYERRLGAVSTAWNMGVTFDANEVRDITGLSAPGPESTVLENPTFTQMRQQAEMAEQQAAGGVGPDGGPPGMGGLPGGQPPPGDDGGPPTSGDPVFDGLFASSEKSQPGREDGRGSGDDGPISDSVRDRLPPEFQKANTIQELLAMPGGLEQWAEHGSFFEGTFDLKPGSRSLGIFNEYRRRKGLPPVGQVEKKEEAKPRELATASYASDGVPVGYGENLATRVASAAKDVDRDPTKPQKDAGNYKKGHVWIQGLPISIENPRGSIRRGTSKDGKPWAVRMGHHYGYVKRTEGKDGDAVDVFIGPDPKSEIVYVVDQVKPGGAFDEHKCLLGFTTEKAARDGYLSCYSPGWKGLGAIKALTIQQFKEWLDSSGTIKPIARQDYGDPLFEAMYRYGHDSGQSDSLAHHYADLFALLEEAGMEIPEDELEKVGHELAGGDWVLTKDNGVWTVRPADQPHDGGLRLYGEHAPKGGVHIAGKFYSGGQFIPGAVLAGASDEVKAKVAKAKADRVNKRAGRGSVDTGKLAESLAKHKDKPLDKAAEASLKRSWNGLKAYHGDLTLHRVEELAGLVQSALDKLPEDEEGIRAQLEQRLAGYGRMVEMAKAAGVTGKVETKAAEPGANEPAGVEPGFTGVAANGVRYVDGVAQKSQEDESGVQSRQATQPEMEVTSDAESTKPEDGAPGRRADVGGTDGGSVGGPAGGSERKPRIVTTRQHLVKPADPGLVPENIRKHLNETQVQGAAKAIESMDKHGGFLLADGTGTGKTRQLLAVAQTAAAKGKKVLIVSPSEVLKPDWKKGTVSGSFANDSAAMGIGLDLSKGDGGLVGGKVHLTTYDQLAKFKDKIGSDTVVLFDESHSLKNWGSARAKHGYDIAKKAGQVMYATATPADKPLHITHLFRAKVFGDKSWEETYRELGMRQVEIHTGGGNYIKQWQIDPKVGAAETYRRMSGLFDRMIEDGLMLKREISLDGLKVDADRVALPPEAKQAVQDVYNSKFSETGGNKAVALMAARMAQEVHKIPHVTKAVQEELAAGRSVVVFAARVNKSGDDVGEDGSEGHATEGTMKLLRDSLEKSGISGDSITELHGGATKTAAQKTKAMQAFQSGKAKVILATVESGGTGVNLDDTAGNAPRTTIVMTPPFSAVSNVQLAGRTWRLNTKSDAKIRHVFADTEIDDWNAKLVARKMKVHGAVVGGEAGRLDVSNEGAEEFEVGGEHTSPYHWRPLVGGNKGGATGTQSSQQQKMTAEMQKAAQVRISGDTFSHKDSIKAAGGFWDSDSKTWTIPPEKADRLRSLKGLSFSDQKQSPPSVTSQPAAVLKPAANTYRVSGNTFAHKDDIKRVGGRWDGSTKTWIIPADARPKLERLHGLKFS